eukprot:Clim_evm39s151 gene=Clim_evmTU39s151
MEIEGPVECGVRTWQRVLAPANSAAPVNVLVQEFRDRVNVTITSVGRVGTIVSIKSVKAEDEDGSAQEHLQSKIVFGAARSEYTEVFAVAVAKALHDRSKSTGRSSVGAPTKAVLVSLGLKEETEESLMSLLKDLRPLVAEI